MRCHAPDPAGGAHSAPPDLLVGFWGEERKGKGKGETERKGKKMEWKRSGGKERGQREGRGMEREEFCAVVIFPEEKR